MLTLSYPYPSPFFSFFISFSPFILLPLLIHNYSFFCFLSFFFLLSISYFLYTLLLILSLSLLSPPPASNIWSIITRMTTQSKVCNFLSIHLQSPLPSLVPHQGGVILHFLAIFEIGHYSMLPIKYIFMSPITKNRQSFFFYRRDLTVENVFFCKLFLLLQRKIVKN